VVTDNGAGIAPADLEGLFDRYANASRRGDSGRSTAGLGLAMARRIAALHGSTLELASRPGAGTRVTFTLPLAAPGAAKAAVVAPAPARSEDRRRNTP
jgi:signal transduction histidine kinase